MTLLDVPKVSHRLPVSIRSVRRILPMSGSGLPASTLRNPSVAAWVRAHGVAVIVCGDDDFELALACGVRPVNVLWRCGPATDPIRRAATVGVVRFVVSTDRHVDVLANCRGSARHVYLDDRGPAVLGERRLDVVGMHCDVDDSRGTSAWTDAVGRLLSRMALMRSCGQEPTRISLAGGSAAQWLGDGTPELVAVASAVNDALDEGCARWRLPRPVVALAALDA